ncbi:MAG: hypothetical protein J5802_02180 [Butyrivibrio sp.]|nr:hypothetical protein [Butyrivibrio sp.]
MLVLFGEGVIKDVCAVEVKPMDVGDGKIVGTQINFTLTTGDRLEYIYGQNIPLDQSGQRAIDFVKKLYENGKADFSHEPVELM